MLQKYRQFDEFLRRFSSILIVCHKNPDEDTIGAALALKFYLAGQGKKTAIFSVNRAPSYLSFLPQVSEMTSDQSVFQQGYEALLFVDCGSIGNTGLPPEIISGRAVANIDHHPSNSAYGSENLLETGASSTCEIVYEFLTAIGRPIDRNSAVCLLAGIMGDTSCFMHSNTGAKTVKIASELIKTGIKIHQIFDYVVRNKTIGGLRLWGETLSRLTINKELNIAYTWIHHHDFAAYGAKEEELDGLANFINALIDVTATAVFWIGPGQVRASWRTQREDIDLSKFCAIFGGGGHRKASGFTVKWQIEEIDGRLNVL